MGWSLFIEEPGDHQLTLPYGVLAGLAVEDRVIWQLARKLKRAEIDFFGSRLVNFCSLFTIESILDIEADQIASSSIDLDAAERLQLVRECAGLNPLQLSTKHSFALTQSRFLFCKHALEILLDYNVKGFATLIPTNQINISYLNGLRKDYSFFFERFNLFLSDYSQGSIGSIVVDECRSDEKYVSVISITEYFEKTTKGRLISQNLIPEPLMANDSLSTINKAAVIYSNILSYGVRLSGMMNNRRYDLDALVRICNLMRTSYPSRDGKKHWSVIYLDDVRTMREITGSM